MILPGSPPPHDVHNKNYDNDEVDEKSDAEDIVPTGV